MSARVGSVLRWAFLLVMGLYFVVPMLAMARFSFHPVPVVFLSRDNILEGWSLDGLITALSEPGFHAAAWTSLQIAVLSAILGLAVMLPVAIAVELRHPKLRPTVTLVTLLPWVIPPVALVVGVAATFRSVAPWFLATPLSLVPFYVLWALPFTYRALDAGLRAINARTLHEAGRSLGASSWTIFTRVLAPNLRPAIVASAILTAALVLGEYAFASLLLKNTLPTYLENYQRSAAQNGMALALAVMVLTSLALAIVVRIMRRRGLDVSMAGA